MQQQVLPPLAAPSLVPALRAAAEQDRAVLDRALKAFVSCVRGYKEHQCSYIFRLEELDLGALAMAVGLLQLPKMAEVKKAGKLTSFKPSTVDPSTVKVRKGAQSWLWDCCSCPTWQRSRQLRVVGSLRHSPVNCHIIDNTAQSQGILL